MLPGKERITPEMQTLADELAELLDADARCVRILWKEVGHDEVDGEPTYRMALDEDGVGRDGLLVIARKEADGKTYASRQPFGLDLLEDAGPAALASHYAFVLRAMHERELEERASGGGEG